MFESARLKLTAWYLVIIMTVSLLFSFVIYSSIDNELHRFERIQVHIQEDLKEGELPPPSANNHYIHIGKPDPQVIADSRNRLILTLGLINLGILIFSGAAGYFLAGRTLRPIQKMVDEQKRFITDASHELRTPLTSLRSEIEVNLRNKTLSLPDAKKLLESNLEEVVSLQTLSDNLLELAQNGKLINQKDFETILLSEVIERSIKKIEPISKRKQIKITSTVKEMTIQGVADRLSELFVILLDNAVKYSPKESEIKILAKKEKDMIAVSVIDHGIGIDSKDIPYIFDRFYRADKSRSKTSGYGLGLSIAKKIVESHGGTIVAKNNHNKGTIFIVRLPL